MIPSPAQYLLRFDDLCPTHHRNRWRRFVPILARFRVKPILAIVPDNRDPELDLSPPDPDFWSQMRELQASGATIGLHGFRHLWAGRGRGLVPLHEVTEFAGIPEQIQRQWIREGLEVLRAHRLNPAIWVAPRHGLDRATLRALRMEGIGIVSDGFAMRPYLRGGLTWIPQQIWAPEHKRRGLWTVCMHANSATDAQVEELNGFLQTHAGEFTSVERILHEFPLTRLTVREMLAANGALFRYRVRRSVKGLLARL